MPTKKTKVKLGLKNLAKLQSYFDYIFVHLRQNARLRPALSPEIFVNFRPEPGSNPIRKPRPTFNSGLITCLRENLNLLKLNDIYKLELVKFINQVHHKTVSQSFYDRFIQLSDIHGYFTRQKEA